MKTATQTAQKIDRHLRNEVAMLSTDRAANYYETKGHAIAAIGNALATRGLALDMVNPLNNEGWLMGDIVNDNWQLVGLLSLSWYRMPSGRYEITCYIA